MWFALLAVAAVHAGESAPYSVLSDASAAPSRDIGLELSVNAQVAAAFFTTDDPLPGGAHDPQHSGFSLQAVELSFGQPVDPYFRLDGHLVFHHGLEVEELYATTLGLPARSQLRVGRFLTRFGRANALHSHQWDSVDQALPVSRLLGPEGHRGVGIEGSVLLPVPWFAELALSATTAHGASHDDGDEEHPAPGWGDLQGTAVLEQFWSLSPALGLLWGLSWATGSDDHDRTELYGTDLHLKLAPRGAGRFSEVVLQGEVVARRTQRPDDVSSDWGAYGQLTWRFRPRWVLGGRVERLRSAVDADGDPYVDPLGAPDRDRLAAALTFRPTEFSQMRLQASRDIVDGRDPYHALFLQLSFGAGKHGAHEY